MDTDNAPAHILTTPVDAEADAAAPPEELAGVRMTREWAGEAWDEARDAFSKKMRLDAWDRLDTKHYANKGKIKIPYKDTVLMLSGDRGSGKTAIATLMGAQLYEQGMEVFSSASLLFGYRIDPVDVFTFAESLPDNCFVFIDEVHGLADRYAEHSTRQRTLSNSIALLRKKGIRLVMASVHEHRVAYSLTGQVHTLIYPRAYRPRRKKNQRYFPAWCYVRFTALGPHPFDGKRLSDSWEIPRPGGKCRRVERDPIPARYIWEAAKLMDSWAKPNIAAGITTSAADVKRRLMEGTGGAQDDGQAEYEADKKDFFSLLGFVAEAINTGEINRDDPVIPWKRLLNAAREHGWRGSDKRGRSLLKDFLELNTQYGIKTPSLMRYFKASVPSSPT